MEELFVKIPLFNNDTYSYGELNLYKFPLTESTNIISFYLL